MSHELETPTIRQKACALALPAFPLALLAGTLVAPTDSTDNLAQLRAAAAHGSSWNTAALLELLAAALIPLLVAAVVHAVRSRGAVLANVGAIFGVMGTLGMTLIGARHLFIYGLAGIDHTSALHVLDRVDKSAGAVAFPLMFAGPIALMVLAGASVRAGIVPRWVMAGAFLFFVSDMLPIPAPEIVQAVVGVATFGMIASGILAGSRDPSASTRVGPRVRAAAHADA